jgi:hypothetical protein
MPAYNFKDRFSGLVVSGAKTQTMRQRGAKIGSIAHCFSGMRTKHCVRLGAWPILSCEAIVLGQSVDSEPFAVVGGRELTQIQLADLALADGFVSAKNMVGWFKLTYDKPHYLPDGRTSAFEGYLITWDFGAPA